MSSATWQWVWLKSGNNKNLKNCLQNFQVRHHRCVFNVIFYKQLGFFFLDPEDIRVLGMGAIWNFAKGTGLL